MHIYIVGVLWSKLNLRNFKVIQRADHLQAIVINILVIITS